MKTKKKTNKALSKRIKITGRKKLMRRRAGQGHFNAKESGNTTRGKRKELLAPLKRKKAQKQLSSAI